MNWSRALSILIVAFCILNLFLGYQVWQASGRGLVNSGAVEPDSVEARLAARNVVMEVELPRQAPQLSFLVVRPGGPEEREFVSTVWGTRLTRPGFTEPELEVTRTDGAIVYEGEGKRLTLHALGTFDLELEEPARVPHVATRPWDAEVAAALAEAWLQESSLLPRDARYDYTVALGQGRYLVRFRQEHQGIALFGGFVEAVVSPAGVHLVRGMRLAPVAYEGQRKAVISAAEAALNASRHIDSKEDAPTVIRQIDLGFYSPPYDAEEWTTVPAWRFLLDPPAVLYINGYTGELEEYRTVGAQE